MLYYTYLRVVQIIIFKTGSHSNLIINLKVEGGELCSYICHLRFSICYKTLLAAVVKQYYTAFIGHK